VNWLGKTSAAAYRNGQQKKTRRMAMAAWLFASVDSISDPPGFGEYQHLAGDSLEKFGGKFLSGGGNIEVMDGDWVS